MSSFALEVSLHWVALALYLVATAVFAHAVLFERPTRVRWGQFALVSGVLIHGAALVHRWVTARHAPLYARYEVLSSDSWIAIVLLLLFVWRRPKWVPIALGVMPLAVLMLGVGIFSNPEVRDLPPTMRSFWLVFHVCSTQLALGAFLLSIGASVVLLWKHIGGKGRFLDKLPAEDGLDAYAVRFVGFGMVFWTISVASGAIWANESWGRYWGWDPIETWSLVTWLGFGSLLHARLFFRVRATLAAWLLIACFVVLMLTLFVLPFVMPSIHSSYFY